MKKVSVVVPVYNVSRYLNSCILFLVNQTIDDYEIIFVNDRSIDLLRYYEKMYPYKIRVIDLEENRGVSYCRNLGLSLADGEFIYFMDSDDVVSINFLNDFYRFCKDNDLLLASSSCFRVGSKELLGDNYLFLGKNDRMQRIIDVFKQPHNITKIGLGVWDKLIKHDMISDKPFIEGKVFEDIAFCHPLVLKAHDVGVWYREDYAFRYTPNSIMESHFSPKPSMIDIIDVCSYSLDFTPSFNPEYDLVKLKKKIKGVNN